MNENWTKFIELFLQGELSPEDTAKLQAELDRNPDMMASMEQQKLVHEAAKRSGERAFIQNIGRGFNLQAKFKTGLFSVLVAGVIAAVAYFTVNHFARTESNSNRTETADVSDAVVGKYEELDAKSELDNLPIVYFEHDGKSTAFTSPKGVVISVPKKTFLLDGKPYNGKAVVQYQEAIDAVDIIKAGLSTTSGDRLLETQGMFGIKAFTPDGRELTINDDDGIYLQVPVDENKAGMQLFQGVKNDKGDIDWQNPAPIERLPVQADMLDLDLFPPGFEPKLDELKWHKKKTKRDSLYLSFEEVEPIADTTSSVANTIQPAYPHNKESFDKSIIHNTAKFKVQMNESRMFVLPNSFYMMDFDVTYKAKNFLSAEPKVHAKKIGEGKYEITVGYMQDSDFMDDPRKISYDFASINQNAENTGQDHFVFDTGLEGVSIEHKSTLKRVNDRVPFYEATYLVSFLRSYNRTITIKANQISPQIFAGRRNSFEIVITPKSTLASFSAATEGKIVISDSKCPLPPSKVLAIWKKKFNGTILATRDFEKRMIAIHGACNEKVFDVYANQINKPLWQLDEQVVKMGYPNFQQFADERVGALKQDNAHMNVLRQYYQSNVSKLKEMAKKDKNFEKALRLAWDKKISSERNSSTTREIKRAAQAFQEEYSLNLNNMLDQLGRKKVVGVTIRGNSYGANRTPRTFPNKSVSPSTRTSSAIYNIDRFTSINTANRTSGEFTDKNGKKARLIYNKMKARIKNAAKYGQLFLYLLPKQLNSFQRINPTNGLFDYSLNNNIQYNAIFVGINENGYFLADKKNVKGGDLGEINLKSVSEEEFERRIEKMNAGRNSKPMSVKNELTWLKTERKDYIVQLQRQKDAEFRRIMQKIVHPCSSGEYYFYIEPEKDDGQNPFL